MFGRRGELIGAYRKVHLVPSEDGRRFESGCSAGQDVPVFDCDFGKLGVQICYDMEFDYGWNELARKGAELIAWPTQSPQTSQPAFRAMQNRCYIISSTWRNNASVFEPTGKIPAQVHATESYAGPRTRSQLRHSAVASPSFRTGEALRKKYGDKVGFRYYEDEDCGIFWSNDAHILLSPKWPVRSEFSSMEAMLAQVRSFYHDCASERILRNC